MKSFIGAALVAAVMAAEDPLMDKLNDLKNAFSQLADTPTPTLGARKSTNLVQIESTLETEVLAEVIAETEVIAEVEAAVEDASLGVGGDAPTVVNVFNGEVENRRRPWQQDRVVCQPQTGQCHPQCPEATWDRQTQRIVFTWLEDTDGCEERPDGTYVTLFSFADNFGQPSLCVDENVALKTDRTDVPDNFLERSVTLDKAFYNPDYKFRLDVPYYVSAFYYFNERYVRTFGMPATSDNPLWVPRYAVEDCPEEVEEVASTAADSHEEDDHYYE